MIGTNPGRPEGGRVHGADSSSSTGSAARTPMTDPRLVASPAIVSTVRRSILGSQVCPLLVVRIRLELVVEKDGVPVLPRSVLKR